MKQAYDAIVIGTGFGGAVTSCRLAQAGLSVGVLERGRRYDKATDGVFPYPRDFTNVENGWLWAHDNGLFDVKPIEEVFVVVSAGYGGGSLIYANVHLRPVPDVFAKGWPAGYSRDELDPYYDLAAYMLDIRPITDRPADIPPKTKAMAAAAERLGRTPQFYYPNIAVDLASPEAGTHANKFGVTQQGCRNCGECDIGCLYGAKNTLDLNYLAVAEKNGAEMGTLCEVVRLAPRGDGYVVVYKDHGDGGVEKEVSARAVFVCAGAINSTELLLRCRDVHGTLPGLNSALGDGYSGNGDFLAFGFDTAESGHPEYGPTITAGMVYDRGEGDLRSWFTVQDGGYPRQVAGLFQLMRSGSTWWPAAGNLVRDDVDRAIRDAAAAAIDAKAQTTAMEKSAVFLSMGRDRANGRLELHPLTHDLRIRWDLTSNLPLYGSEDRLTRDIVSEVRGKSANDPFWTLLSQPVSVHNLGGCRMADDPTKGVTDGTGKVHGYENLYVFDGACLPAATGVNPSHTITAVAERNVERFIRRWRNDATWVAPERAHARPVVDPVSLISIPAGGTAPTRSRPVGLVFSETMQGFVVPANTVPADVAGYVAAEKRGRETGARAQFSLTITAPDLDLFLADKAHAAVAVGEVKVDLLTAGKGAAVTAGVYNLFVNDATAHRRTVVHALPFVGADGNGYLLDGYLDLDEGHFDGWHGTSTLYTVIRAGRGHDAPVCAAGVLHMSLPEFFHQLTTFHVPGATTVRERVEALARFGKVFMGSLWETFPRAP